MTFKICLRFRHYKGQHRSYRHVDPTAKNIFTTVLMGLVPGARDQGGGTSKRGMVRCQWCAGSRESIPMFMRAGPKLGVGATYYAWVVLRHGHGINYPAGSLQQQVTGPLRCHAKAQLGRRWFPKPRGKIAILNRFVT